MSEAQIPPTAEVETELEEAMSRPALGPLVRVADPLAEPADTSGSATYLQQLSLFLMLLSFFLVLNVNAEFNLDRVAPVLGGVQQKVLR